MATTSSWRPGVDDEVEVLGYEDWQEGTVVAVDEGGARIKVSFPGLAADWDTWHRFDDDHLRWTQPQPPPPPPAAADAAAASTTFAFHGHYNGVEATEAAIINALRSRGLKRSLSRDKACIFQWVPYSRITWRHVLAGRMMSSGHYIHSDVGHKVTLFSALSKAVAAVEAEAPLDPASPLGRCAASLVPIHTIDLTAVPHALTSRLPALVSEEGSAWVLKADCANNASAVHFVDTHTLPALLPLLHDAERAYERGGFDASGTLHQHWLLQRHISKPLLLAGRKFHIRVNVLAHGSLALYVHRMAVAHVCTEPYDATQLGNKWSNLTNNAVQRHHEEFDVARNTLGIEEGELTAAFAAEHGAEEAERIVASLWDSIRSVVLGVFHALSVPGTRARKIPFFPDCFEVFGFDFLPGADGELYLLEVNVGPALEGHCKPAISRRVVDDVLQIVLDPLLAHAAAGVDDDGVATAAASMRSEEGTLFERLYFGTFDAIRDGERASADDDGDGESRSPPRLWTSALRERARAGGRVSDD